MDVTRFGPEPPLSTGEQSNYWREGFVDARAPDDYNKSVRLGVRHEVFSRGVRYRKTMIAQYYGIVRGISQPGLISARHAFRGLKRGLYYAGDMNADKKVIIYSWRPTWDFEWVGDPYSGDLYPRTPPPDRVFTVLVQEESQANLTNVFGSIEYWTWLREASDLPGAPIGWAQRYENRLWSR